MEYTLERQLTTDGLERELGLPAGTVQRIHVNQDQVIRVTTAHELTNTEQLSLARYFGITSIKSDVRPS